MKNAIAIARLLSSIFRPMYYPTVGFVILLTCTYLSLLPWSFKLLVLGMVYVCTVSIPALGVRVYCRVSGHSMQELRHQHRRVVPYIIHLVCYNCLMYLMSAMHLPRFMVSIIIVSLMIQVACVLINVKYKISMHSAGSGGVIGAIVAYASIFGVNPIWWLSAAILLSGCVMTSRMVLRQHTLGQVLCGTLLGVACGILGVLV